MSDLEKRNRRISKAYLFGLSDKVWKDDPEPRKPSKSNGWGQLLETPGGFAEWLACDGRRGAIQKAHQRRRASEMAQTTAYANALATAEEVSKDKGDIQASKGKGKESKKEQEDDDSEEWTKEDDEKILDWKRNQSGKPWARFADEIGKSVQQCKDRWVKIKPEDWVEPTNTKNKGGKGSEGAQNQGKKDKKKGEQKKGETPAASAGGDNASGDNDAMGGLGALAAWDEPNNEESSNKKDEWGGDGWGNTDTTGNEKTSNKDDNPWAFENTNNTGNTDDNDKSSKKEAWDSGNGGGGDWNNTGNEEKSNTNDAPWGGGGWGDSAGDTKNDAKADDWPGMSTENKKDNDGPAAWDNPTQEPPATKADSAKGSKHGASKSRSSHRRHSHSKKTSAEESHTIELKPDDTFSTADLQLIARILQKDAADIWQRVSWRFGDKTGRYNIDPDVFEKKITGHVEGKESSKGSRRRK